MIDIILFKDLIKKAQEIIAKYKEAKTNEKSDEPQTEEQKEEQTDNVMALLEGLALTLLIYRETNTNVL